MSQIAVHTELGCFRFRMFNDKAPATCAHFLSVIRSGAYDDASVFRIVGPPNHKPGEPFPIEVIQVGPKGCIESKHFEVPHESTRATGLRHRKGTVSAARIDLNHLFGSFFVCMRDEPVLDHGAGRNPDREGFAAFGQVISGFDVLERIMGHAESCDFLAREIPILSVTIERRNESGQDG